MVEIEIYPGNVKEAKQANDIMVDTLHCTPKVLSTPSDSKDPIYMNYDCPLQAINVLLDDIREPSSWTKIIPDEISLNPKWNLRKRRKIH